MSLWWYNHIHIYTSMDIKPCNTSGISKVFDLITQPIVLKGVEILMNVYVYKVEVYTSLKGGNRAMMDEMKNVWAENESMEDKFVGN